MAFRESVVRTQDERIITISADAYDYRNPDSANISIRFWGEGETQEECASKFKNSLWLIQKVLEAVGVNTDLLKPEGLNISPGLFWCSDILTGNQMR